MSKPLVSIIIPVYNAQEHLQKAITSILNQSYQNLEILICDDASTDNSIQIIEAIKDSRIVFFKNKTNKGYLKTCNYLFKQAEGDYIGFQDADDWSHKERVKTTIDFLEKNNSIQLCGCNFSRKTNDKIIYQSKYPKTHNEIIHYIEKNKDVPFCGATVIFKREVYTKIGGYKLFFDRKGYEDLDWLLRISENFKVANIENSYYEYNYNHDSISRVNLDVDYIKFHIKEIAWYLKEERKENGLDALTTDKYSSKFIKYLKKLEINFNENKFQLYKRVLFNSLNNGDLKNGKKTLKTAHQDNKINTKQAFYLTYRFIRSYIKTKLK